MTKEELMEEARKDANISQKDWWNKTRAQQYHFALIYAVSLINWIQENNKTR